MQSNGAMKTVVVFTTILILQMGLCFSTGFWQPVYEKLTGPSHDSELGLGLVIMQFFLCGFTVFIFAIVLVIVALKAKPRTNDSNEEKQ